MEEESLVLGRKDGIDEHFRNLLEVKSAAPLALLAGEIVHELRLKAIPARCLISINQDDAADKPIAEQNAGRFGPEK